MTDSVFPFTDEQAAQMVEALSRVAWLIPSDRAGALKMREVAHDALVDAGVYPGPKWAEGWPEAALRA